MTRFFALFIALAALAWAGTASLNDAAREFSRKTAAALTPGESVDLFFRNASALSAAEASSIEQAIEDQLRARGFAQASAPEAVAIKITFSENTESLLWIAEIQRGDKRDVVMLAVPYASNTDASPVEPPLAIEKKLLWEQDEPILDAAVVGTDLVVLDPSGVSTYSRENGKWALRRAMRVAPVKPWPKDARGRLQIGNDSIRAYLPGLVCTAKLTPESSLDCSEAVSAWPIAIPNAVLTPGRNWFTAPGIPPFFAVAGSGDGWVATGLDGRAELYDQALKPIATFTGWGSDVAALDSACGRQVLVTKPTGSDEPDAVEPYAIRDDRANASGAAVEVPGPVTALWPSADEHTAVVVSHNLKTGKYAAFSLSIACSH